MWYIDLENADRERESFSCGTYNMTPETLRATLSALPPEWKEARVVSISWINR